MAVFEKTFVQDFSQYVKTHHCEMICFSADNDSVMINAEMFDHGEAASVTGTVTAYAIRADGTTVTVTGSLSGNAASVTLPGTCFAAPGPLIITIQIVSGEVKTTVLRAVFTVVSSTSGTVIDDE